MSYLTLPSSSRDDPIVGWRAWEVLTVDDQVRLVPISGMLDSSWEPRTPTRAVCHGKLRRLWRHRAPHVLCGCGLYATKSLRGLLDRVAGGYWILTPYPFPPSMVIGRVALWGRVVEHQDGYRAEYAYPSTLCSLVPGIAPALANAYGVEAYGVTPEQIWNMAQTERVACHAEDAPLPRLPIGIRTVIAVGWLYRYLPQSIGVIAALIIVIMAMRFHGPAAGLTMTPSIPLSAPPPSLPPQSLPTSVPPLRELDGQLLAALVSTAAIVVVGSALAIASIIASAWRSAVTIIRRILAPRAYRPTTGWRRTLAAVFHRTASIGADTCVIAGVASGTAAATMYIVAPQQGAAAEAVIRACAVWLGTGVVCRVAALVSNNRGGT